MSILNEIHQGTLTTFKHIMAGKTFQEGDSNAAGEECLNQRVAVQRSVVVFTSHTDDLWCDGSWGDLTDTTAKENSRGMCQALSTWT